VSDISAAVGEIHAKISMQFHQLYPSVEHGLCRSVLRSDPPEPLWVWSITAIAPTSPATHGTAATLEEAKAKFREAWEKAKSRCRD
jgi:hypothetical protein